MFKKSYILLVIISAFFACGTPTDEESLEEGLVPLTADSSAKKSDLVVSEVAMEEIVQNISSPVEMAALIKEVGEPFSLDYLCSTDNTDKYNTNFKKALGLGFMGADLGYLNIYSKTSQIIGYITVIKKLSDGLKVGQFFDFSTLKRLATNNKNLDSLMYISVNSFNQMDSYLRDTKRSDLSALIVTGVWIEGMYLATQVVKEKPNKAISERIGEQKVIIDELLLILKNFKNNDNFADLIKDFEEIRAAFADVTIEYEVGEPKTVEEDGNLVIVQTEKSMVNINAEQLKKIVEIIEQKRDKLTEF